MNKISLEGRKILVVEDDQVMLDVLCQLLRMSGAEVASATNGQEALDVLAKKSIDLIISDVQMPIMDGVSLLKEVRKKDPKIPIFLLVTGHADIKEKDVVAYGALGVMHKPFQRKVFLEQIASALENINN